MSIAAVKGLYQDLNERFGAKFLLTARLNQDYLENFFSQLRGLDHLYDHPSPIEVKHRFRLLLIARNSVDLNSSNLQRDNESNAEILLDDTDFAVSDYLSVHLLKNADVAINADDRTTSGAYNIDNLTELTVDDIDSLLNNYEVSDQATFDSTESTIPSTNDDELTTEALKYVAGYVAFKVRRDHPELSTPTGQTNQEPTVCSRWIQTLSRGGLRQPSLVWFQTVQSLEREFRSYHGTGLRKEPGVIKTVVMTLVNKYLSASAVKCFIKTRTFIRIQQESCIDQTLCGKENEKSCTGTDNPLEFYNNYRINK